MPRVTTRRPTAAALGCLAATAFLPAATHAQRAEPGIMATVTAAYAGISANADETRDWQAFAGLFVPDARLVSVTANEQGTRVDNLAAEEWIVSTGLGMAGRGFVEDIVHSEVETYGPIAQVLTTWVTRGERGGAERSHGAATLQLVRTDDGWRIVTWMWTGAVDGVPLPGDR